MNRRFLVAAPLTLLLGACAAKQPHSKQIIRNFDAQEFHVLSCAQAMRTTLRRSTFRLGAALRFDHRRSVCWNQRLQPARPQLAQDTILAFGRDFVSRRFGSTLVISTRNEISNHGREYTLQAIDLWLALPKSIHIIREPRKLTPDGTPDLSSP
jgi:hypothetical protein